MRITNSMMRHNTLWSINRNESLMNKYETQLSTGKKIQKPSDNPIVAVRALKLRANVKEIGQYKTNSEDAISWLSVNEQAISNSIDLLKRARELCVQGSSDIFATSDRASIVEELEQLKTQLLNEGNVNYAGRHIFTGFKTDQPLVFTEAKSINYEIGENFEKSDIETVEKVIGTDIKTVNRIRLGYSNVSTPTSALLTGAGLSIVTTNSQTAGAYEPADGDVYFLEDTGELIFNEDNLNGVSLNQVPASFDDFTYQKSSFNKGDIVPEMYYDCVNLDTATTYTKPNDEMIYQISYNQEMQVNTLGNQLFTKELVRDFDEMINAVRNIKNDGSDEQAIQEGVISEFFGKMLTKLDNHLNTFIREEAKIGGKINRLELTVNRLEDDNVNFTNLLSLNEDVDMSEAIMNLQSQEIVYQASLMSSSKLLQKSLLDFVR